MSNSSDIILTHQQITNKLIRLAWQVYENNMDEPLLWIAGIDERGMFIAKRIANELRKISEQEIRTIQVKIDRDTLLPQYESEHDISSLENEVIVLVDDVLNSGQTMVSAMLPLISKKVKKIQVLVLASRSHRLFPVKADYVGIKMATTLQEHLNFDNHIESDLKLTLT
jgi:pyrimidine operon attenuation protein/uracil phosphoribosyltransferase